MDAPTRACAMTMNRVQFQPGPSTPEFLQRYGHNAAILGLMPCATQTSIFDALDTNPSAWLSSCCEQKSGPTWSKPSDATLPKRATLRSTSALQKRMLRSSQPKTCHASRLRCH